MRGDASPHYDTSSSDFFEDTTSDSDYNLPSSSSSSDDDDDDEESDFATDTSGRVGTRLAKKRKLVPKRARIPLSENASVSAASSEHYFQWSSEGNFVPQLPEFDRSHGVGITHEYRLPEQPEECDYFLQYLDNDLLDHIVMETNRYQAQENAAASSSHEKKWCDITREELLVFFAITAFAIGHCFDDDFFPTIATDTFAVRLPFPFFFFPIHLFSNVIHFRPSVVFTLLLLLLA